MPDQQKTDLLVALGKSGGKPASPGLPKLNVCGDIGLAIARDGTWFYRGSPIQRKPLVKLFASVLRREEDGRYYLVTPVEKVTIAVEATPFIAVEMWREGTGEAQRLSFRTNVDDVVSADRAHPLDFQVEAGGGLTPVVEVRNGLTARLARPVYYELAGLAVEGEGGLGIWSGGSFFPFPAEAG